MKRATFNLRFPAPMGLRSFKGYIAEVPELGVTVTLHKQGFGSVTKWAASEFRTGLYIAGGDTPTEALAEFRRVSANIGGRERLEKVIQKCIEKHGIANEMQP